MLEHTELYEDPKIRVNYGNGNNYFISLDRYPGRSDNHAIQRDNFRSLATTPRKNLRSKLIEVGGNLLPAAEEDGLTDMDLGLAISQAYIKELDIRSKSQAESLTST